MRERGASTRPPHAASPDGYLDTRHAESHRLEGALAQPQRSGELHLAHVARRLAQEDEALGEQAGERGWEQGRRHGPGGLPPSPCGGRWR